MSEVTHSASADGNARATANRYLARTVYLIMNAILALLGIRFLLKLFGANPDATFAEFIYAISAPFMAPFEGLFGVTQANGVAFEWVALVAMLVYALVAIGIVRLAAIITDRPAP